MNLEGKCKEDFEKWYLWVYLDLENVSTIDQQMRLIDFKQKRPSEQYGVFVDFFDSVGINITDGRWRQIVFDNSKCKSYTFYSHQSKDNKRTEARTAAIEKANEIYNQQCKDDKFLAC